MQRSTTAWLRKVTGKSGQAVADWKKGKIPASRLEEIATAVRDLLPNNEEAAPPVWAERLLATVEAVRLKLGITEDELAEAEADLMVLRNLGTTGSGRQPSSGGASAGSGGAGSPPLP